ncbi:MAG: hypothetical protein HQK73_13175 [Desulfamplus sp.]|nr:hypothetical protein [Desulfamplus sp.]MBF0411270.1 hypothetical protein [Desulfamplus sp.]
MISIDNNKLINNRVIFGRICVLAMIITLIGIFDALISSYRKPANHIDIITGRSFEMVGKVYGNIKSVRDISFSSDSSGVTLSFDDELFSGYWLGEEMWRGNVKVDSSLPQGKYQIKIHFNDLTNIKPDDRVKVEKLSTYTVNVYSDAKALRQSDLSFIKRFTAISPWSIVIAFFPIVIIAGGLIFIISGKIETQMAEQGFAEIYRVIRHEKGLEIFFGLGKKHGVEPGEKMNLLNESGLLVSEIVVENIGGENSSAVTDISKIRPGYMVARLESV